MRRQAIDDGGWFDRDVARCFNEATRWDGQNHISRATGSQWDHEEMYRTRRGVYILHGWSQWQGSRPSWRRITAAEAGAWLVQMGCAPETDAEREAVESAEV